MSELAPVLAHNFLVSTPPDPANSQPFSNKPTARDLTRREAIKRGVILSAASVVAPSLRLAGADRETATAPMSTPLHPTEKVNLHFSLNGKSASAEVEARTNLLDLLRDQLELPGTKKGCDHGQCGACTVLIDGRRRLSCLTLAAAVNGKSIVTIEGLAQGDQLHPMQQAFIEHDAFQCGYCTPGQIMSAIGFSKEPWAQNAAAIREGMSGNLCRCGAYCGIVSAVEKARAASAAQSL